MLQQGQTLKHLQKEKRVTENHMLYDAIHIKYSEQVDSERQKVISDFQGLGDMEGDSYSYG